MHNRVSAWELWALALLGIWLQFFRGKKAAPTTTKPTPTGHSIGIEGLHLGSSLWSGVATVLHVVGILLALGALVALAALGFRLFMRRRRLEAMVAEEIILGPDDVANPTEVVSALDGIHSSLLTRYGGAAMGQVSWTFEVIRDADGQVHFVMAAPHGWLGRIEDTWRGVYTNLRFQPWGDQPRSWPVAQQLTLERHWRYPTRIDVTYTSSVIEMIVQAVDRAEGEVRLQWLFTPLPVGPLTAQLRGSLQQVERQARQDQQADPAHPGLGVVDRRDVSQATALLGRSAFRAEVRLAADTWQTMQQILGAISASNAENQWKPRTVVLFKGLWTRWLNLRLPSMGGLGFGRVILFSKPLATLIHVPSARLRVQSLHRVLVRRGPAGPAVPRDPRTAIMRDELGPVGIPEGDRKFNTLFIGSQGGGKSTGMLQQIRVDATWKDRQGRPKAMVLVDIGKDTAKRAMGIIPDDREVIWFDPADPACPWTLNPLAAGMHAGAMANDVLEGLTQVFGEEAIRARSREFLGNALLAVKDVHGDAADFSMVYQMLTNDDFRQDVIDRVQDPHQKDYWQVTFTQTVADNPRFVAEGLAAPRNKIDEVLRSESVREALTSSPGRQQLNLADVVYGRKVLVANLDKARLGKSGARLLGVFLITMLWHALETQTDRPENERIPTALIIDEAQNFISEGFLDILAEGRAYGAQTTLAVRFLGEILSERAILGIRTLVQNLVIFQFELREEAEDFMKRFMRTYANMISPSDEAQDNINFGADDFMRLPKHHVVCRWMVNGSPQQAFLAETIPWEPYYDEDVKVRHLAKQPVRALPTETPASTLPTPDPEWLEEDHPDALGSDDWTDVVEWEGMATQPEAGHPETPITAESFASGAASDVPAASGPPMWLAWVFDATTATTAWDEATHAGHPVLWHRLQAQPGVTTLWVLEGLEDINPAWVPALRQRAVTVLRSLAGPESVVAWAASDQLGCWLPAGSLVDIDAWIAAGQARNIVWHPLEAEAEQAESPPVDVELVAAPMDPVAPPVETEPVTPPVGVKKAPPKAAKTTPRPGTVADETRAEISAALWAALTKRSGLTQAQVLDWQKQFHATDDEIDGTVRWMLERHVDPKNADHIFLSVLKNKILDRFVIPMARQLDAQRKAVADVLLTSERSTKYWSQWLKAHPEVRSLEMFREVVRRDSTTVAEA